MHTRLTNLLNYYNLFTNYLLIYMLHFKCVHVEIIKQTHNIQKHIQLTSRYKVRNVHNSLFTNTRCNLIQEFVYSPLKDCLRNTTNLHPSTEHVELNPRSHSENPLRQKTRPSCTPIVINSVYEFQTLYTCDRLATRTTLPTGSTTRVTAHGDKTV